MKHKLLFSALLFIFCSTELFSQTVTCNYANRKRITFNPAQVTGPLDLTDFPVLISITSDNDLRVTGSGGDVISSNGYDIIFTADDGVTQLSHQLTKYTSTTGELQCWVKIPTLSTTYSTTIYMYFGSSTQTVDPSTTNTWSNGFVGVWHFDNSLNNSTSTSNLNGTNFSTANTTTSMIGDARNFTSASSQYVDVTPYNSAYDITNDITVTGWIRPSSIGADQKIIGNQSGTAGGWKFGVFSDNKIEFEIRDASNGPFLSRSAAGGTALANLTWHYIAGQFSNSGDFIKTYLNGAIDRTLAVTASMASSSGTLKIGREPFASSAFLNGRLDELRIANVIRSADWIATEYNNQNSPSTFYTISSVPIAWDGSNSVNWNTNTNWVGNSIPASGADVVFSNVGNAPTLNASKQVTSLWVQNNTTLTLSGSNTLSVSGDILNCGYIQSVGSAVLVMNSSTTGVQNQSIGGTGTYNLINLTISNTFSPSPKVVLNKDVNILGDLSLVSGIVSTTSTNLLFLASPATSSSGSANSFVSGPISKNGTSAFVFPVGKGSRWRRIRISAPTVSSTFRAEYFDSPYTTTNSVNSPLIDISKTEYWQLDRLTGTGNASVSLYWESATASGIDNCADLTIARWNGSSWDERAGTTVSGSSCSGSGTGTIMTNAVVTAFSPFTFGSKSATLNPLPVELVSFTAGCVPEGALVEWSTATENNSDYYVLERSTDGYSWEMRSKIKAAGRSLSRKDYSFVDSELPQSVVYYRLTQFDFDGSSERYPLIFATCTNGNDGLRLYPNPAKDVFSVETNLSAHYGNGLIRIVDPLGTTVYEQDVVLTKGQSIFTMPLNLNPGAYTVLIQNAAATLPPQRLIIR